MSRGKCAVRALVQSKDTALLHSRSILVLFAPAGKEEKSILLTAGTFQRIDQFSMQFSRQCFLKSPIVLHTLKYGAALVVGPRKTYSLQEAR